MMGSPISTNIYQYPLRKRIVTNIFFYLKYNRTVFTNWYTKQQTERRSFIVLHGIFYTVFLYGIGKSFSELAKLFSLKFYNRRIHFEHVIEYYWKNSCQML